MEAKRKLMQQQEFREHGDFASVSPRKSSIPLPRRATPSRYPETDVLSSPSSPIASTSSRPLPTPSVVLQVNNTRTPAARPATSIPQDDRPPHPRITCRGWSVSELCDTYPKFKQVPRVSALAPSEVRRALEEYDKSGLPLIIEDWHKHPKWRGEILNMEWVLKYMGDKEIPEIHVRNVHNRKDIAMSLGQFVERSRAQDVYNVPGESERLYWKDAECPDQWREWLHKTLTPSILPGCPEDLLRHLQPSEAVESLVCYLGIGDTYTPAHKDLCASSGHNLMCFAEDDGSSFWFMTQSSSAPQAAKYFQRKLGQELDWESRVTTVGELGRAPFDVFVAEQKVGDLVLVPSRSVHQVVNHGGLAMKISWSRITIDNLKSALQSELPIYRRVCRPEQYRVKTVLYRSLLYYTRELQNAPISSTEARSSGKDALVDYSSPSDSDSESLSSMPVSLQARPSQSKDNLAGKLHTLVELFDEVLREEYASCHTTLRHVLPENSDSDWSLTATNSPSQRLRLAPPSQSYDLKDKESSRSWNLACDFCGADIFQSFFECQNCRSSDLKSDTVEIPAGDGLLVCPGCYVEGRSCDCEDMEPMQCRPFNALLQDRNRAAKAVCEVLPIGEIQQLDESELPENGLCLFEAACVLRKNRKTAQGNCTRRCRGGHNGPSHDIRFIEGIHCPICHGTKCFVHLLQLGSHCAQAILARSKGLDGNVWHELHKQNTMLSPKKRYKVDPNFTQRLLIAARDFPRCKPVHWHMQLGWYDKELMAQDPVADPDTLRLYPSQQDSAQSTQRPESPLTPLESPCSSPNKDIEDPSADDPPRTEAGSVIIISESEDEEGPELPSVPPPTRKHYNRVYVEITKNASSPAPAGTGSRNVRSLKSDVSSGSRQRGRSGSAVIRSSDRSSSASRATTADLLGESYGTDLASALERSHNVAPIFTPAAPHERPAKRNIRRIIESDLEEDPSSSHHPDPTVSTPLVQPSSAHPITQRLAAVGEAVHAVVAPPALPRRPTARRSNPSSECPPTTSDAMSSATSSTPHVLKKRKRSGPPGPPGVPNIEQHMKQRQRDEKRKKARFEAQESDEVVEILMDVEQGRGARPPKSTVSVPERRATGLLSLGEPSLSGPSNASHSASMLDSEPPTPMPQGTVPMPDAPIPPITLNGYPLPLVSGSSKLSIDPALAHLYPLLDSAPAHSQERLDVIKNTLGQLVESVYAAMPPKPAVSPALEQVVQQLKGEIIELREQVHALQGKNDEQEKLVAELLRAHAKLDRDLKTERSERGLAATHIRELKEKVSHCENVHSREAMMQLALECGREQICSLMPTIRDSMHNMARDAVNDSIKNAPVVLQEHTTTAFVINPASNPGSSIIRSNHPQIEDGKHLAQGHYPGGQGQSQMRGHGGQMYPNQGPPHWHRGRWTNGNHRRQPYRHSGPSHPPTHVGDPTLFSRDPTLFNRDHWNPDTHNGFQGGHPVMHPNNFPAGGFGGQNYTGNGTYPRANSPRRSRSPFADRRWRAESGRQSWSPGDPKEPTNSRGRSLSADRMHRADVRGRNRSRDDRKDSAESRDGSRGRDEGKGLSLGYPERESIPPTATTDNLPPTFSIARFDDDMKDDDRTIDILPPTSSVAQFDEDVKDDDRRSATQSPIESYPPSEKSRSRSDIQESSFTREDEKSQGPVRSLQTRQPAKRPVRQ